MRFSRLVSFQADEQSSNFNNINNHYHHHHLHHHHHHHHNNGLLTAFPWVKWLYICYTNIKLGITIKYRFLGQCSSYRALCAALSKCQSRRSLIGNQPNLNRVFTEFT